MKQAHLPFRLSCTSPRAHPFRPDFPKAAACLRGCGFQPQGFTGWKPVPHPSRSKLRGIEPIASKLRWKIAGLVLFSAVTLLASGCAESHASAGHDHAAEPAPAATYKAGRGLRLSEPALAFAGVGTAEFTGRLPAAALLRTARGDFVYVANDGWLLRTPVKLGAGNGVSFEVSDGLYEGDVIAVSGTLALWLAEIQAVNGGVGCADGH